MNDDEQRQRLLENVRAAHPALEKLLAEVSDEWGYEDRVYRFYHQSFKVYRAQTATERMVAALQALAPDRELNSRFLEIVRTGTGKEFALEHNGRWMEETRPILEAFFHARFFLEMAVRYGRASEVSNSWLSSGWAAFLYLYDLR